VASYAGDGVLAFFGYPHAREDASERAVHAGLAIVEAADDSKPEVGVALQMRVGIATGLVVDAQASGGAKETVAVGKPLNLAVRLQEIAAPGTVVIAESTRRLLGDLFALEDLGSRLLEGYSAQVKAWRVVGGGMTERRFVGQVSRR
jgi:class 3 adenylate cyclase